MTKTGSQGVLRNYFPALHTKQELLALIAANPSLGGIFYRWPQEAQEEFLECCSGAKGMKVLYDGVFKEIFNPEATPERLESLLNLLLGRRVSIKAVLPNDSVRLGAETSLLYTDILVELEDGSIGNIEVQKIGYAFPSQRCACYSSDHLMRQYKRVRGERGKHFSYRDIKNVYTIVFFERSPQEFHKFPAIWMHKFKQASDSGIEMDFLQEYILLPLDIYRKAMQNKDIETELEAWLAFLSFDAPERIEELITRFPKFKALYQQICDLCRNTEKVMNMYSKELQELDHNTVLYMIDEMQAEIDRKAEECRQMEAKKQQMEAEHRQMEAEHRQMEAKTRQMKAEHRQMEAKTRQMEAEHQRQLTELEQRSKEKDELILRLQRELEERKN